MLEFKIIALGDQNVGKTSISQRYTLDKFEETMSTIGSSFSSKEHTLTNGKKVKLKLVDTGGEEKYRSLGNSYYRNADGVLFVFAHNDRESFENIENWVNLFDKNSNNKEIPKFLIGNKNDLEKFSEENSFIDFIKGQNILRYISTSAKDNININEMFKELADIIDSKYNKSFKQNTKQLQPIKKKEKPKCSPCFREI